jgi:hypothetical protein
MAMPYCKLGGSTVPVSSLLSYFRSYWRTDAIQVHWSRSIAPPRLLTRVEVSKLLDARYRIRRNDGSEMRLAMGRLPAGMFQGAGMGSGLARTTCDLCFIVSMDAVHLLF